MSSEFPRSYLVVRRYLVPITCLWGTTTIFAMIAVNQFLDACYMTSAVTYVNSWSTAKHVTSYYLGRVDNILHDSCIRTSRPHRLVHYWPWTYLWRWRRARDMSAAAECLGSSVWQFCGNVMTHLVLTLMQQQSWCCRPRAAHDSSGDDVVPDPLLTMLTNIIWHISWARDDRFVVLDSSHHVTPTGLRALSSVHFEFWRFPASGLSWPLKAELPA